MTHIINPIIGRTAEQSVRLFFAVCSAMAAAALFLSLYFFRKTGANAVRKQWN
ncbi:MAG TPA: hypothetical protein VEG39_05350 [Clostridia bacterium]|nr:hypothetical protein [Clostridia bacterium]